MRDTNDLVKLIQKIAMEAVEAGKPMNVTFGKVLSPDDLNVDVDQKFQLKEKQLMLGETLREYEAELEVELEEMELELELEIEGETVLAKAKGTGTVKGKGKILRRLDAGDDVILMRMQGGQKYMVIDKVKKDDA